MLRTLVKKEILDSLFSYRFLFGTILCLVVIPLGVYVNLTEYQQRMVEYRELVRLYQERSEGKVYFNFKAEGFRPPSILSIFAVGLENFIPNKTVTSNDGLLTSSREQGLDSMEALLFGKMDFLFNVAFVVSLLGFILTFNSISGEKEDATLRMILSNPVPRWQILAAKIAGNFLLILVPFFVSCLAALLILNMSGITSIFQPEIMISFGILAGASLLFILSMCLLGIFISVLTHRSTTSMVVSLFIWAIIVLCWPRITPMIAEIIKPVKSQKILNYEKTLLRRNLDKEHELERRKLYDRIDAEKGNQPGSRNARNELEGEALATYDSAASALANQYERRIAGELQRMDDEYFGRWNTQIDLARSLSRLSPVSCFTYIATELSGTGLLAMNNFSQNAKRFQNEVKENVYDRYILHRYGGMTGRGGVWVAPANGFDPQKAPVPHMNYAQLPRSDILKAVLLDIVLLILFNAVFFAVGFLSFLEYDVR